MAPDDHPLEVTFLGTGAAMPSGRRVQTGVVVGDDDRRVLVDCGSGVLHRLAQTGIGYETFETVLVTHHHLDHVADLMPLLKARWLAGETSIEIVGPAGTKRLLDALFETHDYMQERFDLEVRDIEPGRHAIAGFDVEAVETVHSMPCLAYRFDDRLTISGDTEPSEAVADLADGSAVCVHECAFPDDIEVSNHTRPTELGELLATIEVGRVYLTHLYPHCDGREDEMRRAVAHAWGEDDVVVAEDRTTVRITPTD